MQGISFLNKNRYFLFFESLKSVFLRFLRIQLPQHFFSKADTKKQICIGESLSSANCRDEFRMLH